MSFQPYVVRYQIKNGANTILEYYDNQIDAFTAKARIKATLGNNIRFIETGTDYINHPKIKQQRIEEQAKADIAYKKERIKDEQNRVEKAKIEAEKQAEKQKQKKIEALIKALPENEKKEFDLQKEVIKKAKEKHKREKDKIDAKTIIIQILFISIFVFLYTFKNIVIQYHSGKLTNLSDIYTGLNNIIFLISIPLAIWAIIAFQKYILKPSNDKTLGEKICNIIALISLISTYISFRNTYDSSYIVSLAIISFIMFYISFIMYKKRLKTTLIPFEEEIIIQENKYEKLLIKLQLN